MHESYKRYLIVKKLQREAWVIYKLKKEGNHTYDKVTSSSNSGYLQMDLS